MKKLVFATGNKNKLKEVNALLDGLYDIVSMQSIGCTDDIPEPHDTLEANALEKARYLYSRYEVDCFAEDTGLEIKALNGEPGVLSARYAGEEKSATANMALVLKNLADKTDRSAQFRTVVALILGGEEYLFEGIASGHIIEKVRGTNGFGYDPIFVPSGEEKTFAEIDASLKNVISHRGKAIKELVAFLTK